LANLLNIALTRKPPPNPPPKAAIAATFPVPKISCKALLFDMDGVLVDSTPVVARVWSWWARQHGLDPDDIVPKVHGRPSLANIREFLPNGDHEAEHREVERREMLDVDGVEALPGVREILSSLPADRWIVVTSGTKPLVRVRFRAAGLAAPRQIVTADDISRGKPDAEPYLTGAALLGFDPRDCLVIEDTPAGVRSGKAAGACVVALQTTKPNDLLIAAGADWIVKDCSSLCLAKAPLDTNDRQGNLIIDATLSGSQPFNKADSREGRS
jgi:sugar-phosphatase